MREDYLSYLARNEDRQPQRQPEPDLPSASGDEDEGRATVRPLVRQKVKFIGNDEADRIEMRAMSGSNEDTPQIRLLTQVVTLLETLPERLVSAMKDG